MDVQILRICEVVSVDDELGMDRIKVKMIPEDNNKTSIKDLAYVFPLLPKNLFIKPKVGETVIVMSVMATNGNTQRFYIGPVIPQINKMEGNLHKVDSTSFFDGGKFTPGKSPYTDPASEGVYPDGDDISIIGKRNTDIQLKDNDLRIRCGARINDPGTETGIAFNAKDPAYIKMKYDQGRKDDRKSSIDIVADKINLVGSQSNDFYNTVDKNDLFTDEELDRFLSEAHQLPYGDVLVDFLKKLRDAFISHTHPMSMAPPVMDIATTEIAKYDLDSILSDSVRIN